MPIFSYECTNCGQTVERVVPAVEREDQTCETCETVLKRIWNFSGHVWAPSKSSSSGHSV